MPRAIKPKPGTYKGVDYRSQLEIAWAKLFDKYQVRWRYVDESTHDFEVFDDDHETVMFVEVKPDVEEAVDRGIERFFDLLPFMDGSNPAVLLVGSPPSVYSRGAAIHCIPICFPDDDSGFLFCRGCVLSPGIAKNGRLDLKTYEAGHKGYIVSPSAKGSFSINAVVTDILTEIDRSVK